MVDLPDISTDAGILSRLIIAECMHPGDPAYNRDDGLLTFRLMQATVANRLNNNPGQFGAAGATCYADVITAPGQFAGFIQLDDQTVIAQPVADNIASVLDTANQGDPGPCAQFVQDILDRVNGTVEDPLAGCVSINGTAVVGGCYGWRTAGSGDPGGRFFPVPETLGGLLLGNQFYTLLPA
jgi:hypothetical protein